MDSALAPNLTAPQQKPRPLPLFLDLLRRETAASPERMTAALRGLRAYQDAPRPDPPEPPRAVCGAHGACLRDYGGSGPAALFIPSLINPPTVLDLGGRSLLRWLAEQGFRPLLLDWGWDIKARRDLSVADHVEHIILPMLRELEEPPHLVGYCLGGTMAAAAAVLAPVRSLTLLAAPWHFSAFGEARETMLDLWARSSDAAKMLGALPMEVLQTVFWSLDPARTVAKFEHFAEMPPGSTEARSFIMLEDWANDGPPIPYAAARELFEDLIGGDRPGGGTWQVAGKVIDPAAIACPILNIVSTSDRIVPAASAMQAGERVALASGHVGMVVGSRAPQDLWPLLSGWLSRATTG